MKVLIKVQLWVAAFEKVFAFEVLYKTAMKLILAEI